MLPWRPIFSILCPDRADCAGDRRVRRGYQKRRFALLGVYGQSIFVDPELKLVLVLTAAARTASVGRETFGRERDALWRGLVATFGSW